jgi:hypothetical protein
MDTGRVSVIRLYSFNLLLGLTSCLFPLVSPISILCAHLVSHMHATNHVPLICLHLGNLAIFLQYHLIREILMSILIFFKTTQLCISW